jgi:uncharacterized protein (TIGR00725 family)
MLPGRHVAVVGPGEASAEEEAIAEAVGRALAERGALVVTGGLGGVMAAASRAPRDAGGLTLGLLPGDDRSAANPWVAVAIPTGVGELRNGLVVRTADSLIAVGGGHGTLSEIALALKLERRVVGVHSWQIPGVEPAGDAAGAIALTFG